MSTRSLRALAFLLAVGPCVVAQPAPDVAKLEKQRCPKPTDFAIVFSFGYGDDLMPPDEETFDKLLLKIKDGGFNTIHCTFTDKRLDLCKKHGVKMMIHLLAEQHHVYKSPDKAKALCEKLRDNPDVWGYNIWNDTFAKTGEGRRRDVNTVRQWDPTHPAYSGTYRVIGMSHLVNADVMGYYDFHWKRGIGMHFPHVLAFSAWARERDAFFYSWLATTSGIPGKGNFNRSLYSATTSIAFGQKGILWFLATEMMDRKSLEWTEVGRDIIKVNQEILPLSKELPKLANPTALYTTTITKTPNNEPLAEGRKESLPPGLEKHAFPKDFWLQPVGGEFLLGVFQDERKHDVVYVANHNAYADQKVELKLARAVRVALFDRKTGKWQPLTATDGVVRFALAAGGGELVRFGE